MPVSYIEVRNFFKFFSYCLYGFRTFDDPKGVPETVRSHEVIFRSAGGDFSYYILKYGIVRKCEKHRLDIGIVAPHMFHAVFFLVASCELMFLDASFHIVRHPCADYKSVLRAAIHCLGIDIIILFVVLHQPSVFLEFTEVLHRFVIYGRIMLVKSGFKIDFRFDDVVKAFFVAFRFFAGFLAV